MGATIVPEFSDIPEGFEVKQNFPVVGTRGNAPGESILNPDGTSSSERTISVGFDGVTKLIPTIVPDEQGFLVKRSDDEAIELFRQGKNPSVGDFGSREEADAFAKVRSEGGGRNFQQFSDIPEGFNVAPSQVDVKNEIGSQPMGTFNDPRGALFTVGSAAVAAPASGLAGLAGLAFADLLGKERPMDVAARFQAGTQEALTIDPVNPASQRVLEGIGKAATAVPTALGTIPLLEEELQAAQDFNRQARLAGEQRFGEVLEEGPTRAVGGAVLEATGSPLLATVTETLPAALASLTALKQFRGIPKKQVDLPTREPPTLQVPDQPVSIGKPTLDRPVDFTPPISSEKIVANLRKGKSDKVAEAVVPDVEIVESAQRLGVDLNPEHYSTNAAFQDVTRALKTRPGSQLQAREVAVLSELSRQADDLVTKSNGHLDRAEFSQEIGAEIGTTIDDLSRQSTRAYDAVKSAVPAATKVETSLIRDFMDNKLAELGGDKSLLTPIEKKLLTLTRKTKEGAAIPPTYAAIDRVRKDVGNGFSRQGPFADVDSAILSEVYGVLSDVQNGVARSFGVGDLYDSARGLVVTRKALEDTAVQLFGRNISGSLVPKLRGAATGLVKGDVTKFNQLIEALPTARRSEAAATVLSEIFAGGSRSGGQLGTGFVQSFQAINRNKAAKDLLFSHLSKEARQRFDDIGRIMTGIVESNRKPLGNPSGSAGPIVKALDDLTLVQRVYEGGKKIAAAEGVSSAVGAPGIGASVAIGSLISKQRTPIIVAADQMLSSPEFTRAIGRAVQGDISTANKIIENSPQFKNWQSKLSKQDAQNLATVGFIGWVTGEENGR